MAIYPLNKFRYSVKFEGGVSFEGGFNEITGFDFNVDVAEYREGNDPEITVRKLPGLRKYSNVTFKWGVIEGSPKTLYEWLVKIGTEADNLRATVTISLNNYKGEEAAVWVIKNAWPVKYTAPDFNATASTDVAIESLELAHEGLTRTT